MDALEVIDLKLDINDPKADVVAIARKVLPEWRESVVLETLKGGSGNTLFKCKRPDDFGDEEAFLVRVYGQLSTKLFRPNPCSALWVMRFLATQGCCAEVLCRFANGFVYRYTTGTQLTREMIKDPLIRSMIAKEMAKVNSLRPGLLPETAGTVNPVCSAGLFGRMDHYLNLLPVHLSQLNTNVRPIIFSKKELIAEAEFVKKQITLGSTDRVLIHGDIYCSNIIYNHKQR